MKYQVDFLVIGSGIAGLSYALKVAEYGTVCILTKANAFESSTKYAQGGIAAVMYNPDSYEKHIQDTLIAGDGLCDEEVVRMTIMESTARVKELIQWGVHFDKSRSGLFDLHREGGHSEYRVLHHKDKTGEEIERELLNNVQKHPNITLKENHFTVDIITQHHLGEIVTKRTQGIHCYGAYVLNPETRKIDTYLAKITLLATGGLGSVYQTTTNPMIATGDGVAMVHRARGVLKDMEFIQFHPTSLYNPVEKPSFLITEALRGAGAVLKTDTGEEFMQKYDSRLSLAPRDIVARAIDSEMKRCGSDFVYVDARHIDRYKLVNSFPNIYAKCLEIGINITKEMIPVVPAAHYACGGIAVNLWGESSITNLYASGECACTGLHGANRLASNSLLEALVYSNRSSISGVERIGQIQIHQEIPEWNAEGMLCNEEMILITQTMKELQAIMSNYVGIVRSEIRLKRAFDRLEIIHRETEDLYNRSVLTVELCEMRNLVACAYLIIKMASARKQSQGLHFLINPVD